MCNKRFTLYKWDTPAHVRIRSVSDALSRDAPNFMQSKPPLATINDLSFETIVQIAAYLRLPDLLSLAETSSFYGALTADQGHLCTYLTERLSKHPHEINDYFGIKDYFKINDHFIISEEDTVTRIRDALKACIKPERPERGKIPLHLSKDSGLRCKAGDTWNPDSSDETIRAAVDHPTADAFVLRGAVCNPNSTDATIRAAVDHPAADAL